MFPRHGRCNLGEPVMREPEITCRIHREHLKELLDTEAPALKQRTTAKMPAVTLTGLLCLSDEDLQAMPPPPPPRKRPRGTDRDVRTLAIRPLTPPPDTGVLVRFTPPSRWPLDQWPAPVVRFARQLAALPRPVLIALSACMTLTIARLISLL
jgi:hypothetical protein